MIALLRPVDSRGRIAPRRPYQNPGSAGLVPEPPGRTELPGATGRATALMLGYEQASTVWWKRIARRVRDEQALAALDAFRANH
jgi:hypothetical protein